MNNREQAIQFVHDNISSVLLTTKEFTLGDSADLVDALVSAKLIKIVCSHDQTEKVSYDYHQCLRCGEII